MKAEILTLILIKWTYHLLQSAAREFIVFNILDA